MAQETGINYQFLRFFLIVQVKSFVCMAKWVKDVPSDFLRSDRTSYATWGNPLGPWISVHMGPLALFWLLFTPFPSSHSSAHISNQHPQLLWILILHSPLLSLHSYPPLLSDLSLPFYPPTPINIYSPFKRGKTGMQQKQYTFTFPSTFPHAFPSSPLPVHKLYFPLSLSFTLSLTTSCLPPCLLFNTQKLKQHREGRFE